MPIIPCKILCWLRVGRSPIDIGREQGRIAPGFVIGTRSIKINYKYVHLFVNQTTWELSIENSRHSYRSEGISAV